MIGRHAVEAGQRVRGRRVEVREDAGHKVDGRGEGLLLCV